MSTLDGDEACAERRQGAQQEGDRLTKRQPYWLSDRFRSLPVVDRFKIFASKGSVDAALQHFHLLDRAGHDADCCRVEMYNCVMSLCGRRQRSAELLREGRSVFEELISKARAGGDAPNAHSFKAYVRFEAAAQRSSRGKSRAALSAFERCLKLVSDGDAGLADVSVDHLRQAMDAGGSAAMFICTREGFPLVALDIFERLRAALDGLGDRPSVSIEAFNSALSAAADVGDAELAARLLLELAEGRLGPGNPSQVTVGAVLKLLQRRGLIEECERLLSSVGLGGDVAELVPAALAAAGAPSPAVDERRTAAAISRARTHWQCPPADVSWYNSVIGGYRFADGGADADGAWRLLERMIGGDDGDGDGDGERAIPQPDAVSYNSVAAVCAQAGDLEGACEAMLEANQQGIRGRALLAGWNSCLAAAAKVGNVKAAQRILATMLQKSGGGRRRVPFPNTWSFNSVIHACAVTGSVHIAVSTFRKMDRYRVPKDEITYSSLFEAIARSKFSGADRGERAIPTVSQLLAEMHALKLPLSDRHLSAALRAVDSGREVLLVLEAVRRFPRPAAGAGARRRVG